MDFTHLVNLISDYTTGWILMVYVVVISFIYTIALRGIQFRYFFTALKTAVCPSQNKTSSQEISPFQAFINTVNSNLGNGSIAGVATAIYAGGPGAAFWMLLFGFILMSVRFAEVYISTLYGSKLTEKSVLGGPMLYLKDVPGGSYLPMLYAIFCLSFGLIGANIIQANSIALSFSTTWSIAPLITGIILELFVLYILFGGAQRIVQISMSIVPIKIAVFIFSSVAVLIYHRASLYSAICLMVTAGLGLKSFGAGVIGFSLQQMIGAGMSRSIFSTESGLGSAAILFGSTGNDDAVQNGFMGMVSTFISTCVGFLIALCIVVSGVADSGLNSTALTIASFNTVFGSYAGWIVSFLSVSFGLGVLVSYAYVARATWLYISNNRFSWVFIVLYGSCAFIGTLATVGLVWDLCNIAIAGTLFINLYGLLMLLPKIRKELLVSLKNYKA